MTPTLDQLVALAIAEDVGSGDITTGAIIAEGQNGKAVIRTKQELILAGVVPARMVFEKIDPAIIFKAIHKDGDHLVKGKVIAEVEGNISSILTGERTALNFLQHLSGVATITRIYLGELEGTKAKILDTRKTTPGMRELEKEAVKLGGGQNHRMGLFDMYLIKDNHIEAAGSVAAAIKKVKAAAKIDIKIEVEVKNLEELESALKETPDIIMLDNFPPDMVKEAVRLTAGRIKLEASGNIGLENIREYALTGVDYISVGAITHSAPAADITMLWRQ